MNKSLMLVMAITLGSMMVLAGCETKSSQDVEIVTPGEDATPAEHPGTTPVVEAPKVPVVPAATEPGMPCLFSFETDESVAAWVVEEDLKEEVDVAACTENATEGKRSLKVTLKSGEWPGIRTTKLPKDWSAYKELKFDVSSDVDFRCAVRIDDVDSTDYETRFNGGDDVEKGGYTVTIDLEDVAESIDTKKVILLCIFSSGVDEPLTFCMDNVRLVK